MELFSSVESLKGKEKLLMDEDVVEKRHEVFRMMKRKSGWIRGITAVLLCVSLLLTCSGGAFAASDQSANLEKAILAVKSVVDIPEDYQFEYHSYENEVDGKQYTQWELRWYDENYENSVYANVNQDFQVVSLESYSSEDQKGIGNISRSEAASSAMDFLKKAIPQEADRMREEAATSYNAGNTFYFHYSLYENGIPVPFKAAMISVNKFTGKVESFYREGYDANVNSFPSIEGAIDMDGAKAAYLKEYGMKLQYNLKRDYQKKTTEAIPAYVLEAGDGRAIDALTGAPATLYEGVFAVNRFDTASEAAAENGAGANKNQLSADELAEIQNTEGLLSQSQALAFVEKTGAKRRRLLERCGKCNSFQRLF